jgi:hypothetical protein
VPAAPPPVAAAVSLAPDEAAAEVELLLDVLLVLLQADSASATALIPATVAVILRLLRENTRPTSVFPWVAHVRALTRLSHEIVFIATAQLEIGLCE